MFTNNSGLFKTPLPLQHNRLSIHITQENRGFVVLEKRLAFDVAGVAVFEDLDGVGNEVEADLCHYTGVYHMADVDFRNFEVAFCVFFEVVAEHTVGLDA